MHEPIWKIDFRLLRKLAVPYLTAFVTLMIALTGIIALIEMLYFATDEFSSGTITSVYGIEMELTGILPWVSYVFIAILGIFFCRYSFPFAARNWNDVMATVQRRLEQ